MDNKIWARTLLNLYEHLKGMINSSEHQINSTIRCMGQQGGDTLRQFDKLIKQIAHKDLYKLTLQLIDDILNQMNEKKILIMRHIEHMPCKCISEVTNMSLRTVFRKYDAEVESFAKTLNFLGYDCNKCNETWGDIKIFRNIYTRIERNEIAYSKEPKITFCMDIEKRKDDNALFNYGHCMGVYDKIYSKN